MQKTVGESVRHSDFIAVHNATAHPHANASKIESPIDSNRQSDR